MSKLFRNSRTMLILGALLAAVAFVLVFSILSKAQQSPISNAAALATPTPIPAPELVAKTDVPAFTPITDLPTALQYFKEEQVKGYVNPDYVKGASGLGEIIAAGPRHLALKVPVGQPLMTSYLISNTVAGAVDYSTLLNKGEVAESVSVQPVAAANGNIQPSDHVDLLLTMKFDLTKEAAVKHVFYTGNGTIVNDQTPKGTIVGNLLQTQSTLQNLRVLNVVGTTYTLAVSPQDALLLKWVKDMNGTVDLVVRSSDDSGRQPVYFHTTSVLPDYLIKSGNMRNKFVLP